MSDYYEFPSGVQAIDIARHLTGNASHAVCYIARSSRLDGNNKGDTAGDLRKAIDFLRDELKRVEVENRTEAGLLRILSNANIGDLHTVDGEEYWQKIDDGLWKNITSDKFLGLTVDDELAERLSND